jgi:hypothetical protein
MLNTAFIDGPLLEADPEVFARNFDQRCFAFTHRLSNHPLLKLERILMLARQLGQDPDDVHFDAGDARVDQRWDQMPACSFTIEELMRQIETAGAWIILRRAQKDPEYAALLESCMEEFVALAGRDLSNVMKVRNAVIFVTSPNRITPYHIDRECSLLLQIHGSKTISIFDRADREVLPEVEIERFWARDNNAAIYKPEYQDRASIFELSPGRGVHIPVGAPHWVQNGPEISVSLNINFHYHDAIKADIYRVNYWLRRIGITPTPPQRSPVRDSIKRNIWGFARKAKKAWQHHGISH